MQFVGRLPIYNQQSVGEKKTALHEAADTISMYKTDKSDQYDNTDMIELLLRAGADPTLKNHNGDAAHFSPEHYREHLVGNLAYHAQKNAAQKPKVAQPPSFREVVASD